MMRRSFPPGHVFRQAEFDTLQQRIAHRFDYVAPKLLDENVKGFLAFWLASSCCRALKAFPASFWSRALDDIRLLILAEFHRRDQIAEWTVRRASISPPMTRDLLGRVAQPELRSAQCRWNFQSCWSDLEWRAQ